MQIKIFNNGLLVDLSGQSIDLILKKSDGTLIEKNVDASNISNGVVVVQPKQQTTLVEGLVSGELQIYTSDTLTSTNTFTFNVDASLADDVLEVSKDDIQVLADLRNLINSGQITLDKYKECVLAIGNSVDAIEALANIKAYINTNLPQLQSENAKAAVNIESETAQNTQATKNISDLTAVNNVASSNISSLNSKNSTATSNISALDSKNSVASSNINNLATQNTNATNNISSLSSKNTTATGNISNLDTENLRAESNVESLKNFGNINVDGGTFFEIYVDWTTNGGTF